MVIIEGHQYKEGVVKISGSVKLIRQHDETEQAYELIKGQKLIYWIEERKDERLLGVSIECDFPLTDDVNDIYGEGYYISIDQNKREIKKWFLLL